MANKPERNWIAEPPLTNGEQLRMIRERQKRKTGRKAYQRDAANLLGIDDELYRAIEYDRRALRESEARILADAWGEHWEDFYVRLDAAEPKRPKEVTPPKPGTGIPPITVPIIGPVKAGEWSSPLEAPDEEPIPADMYAPDIFCSYIVGDSMDDSSTTTGEPFLKEGDLACFRATEHANRRIRPRIGDVVMARNQDNDLTVKQLKHDGVFYVLHPLNPKYENLYSESWQAIGILTGYIRDENGDTIRRNNPKGLRPKK